MMFSCEKQKTPSRPPLMVVSMTTPESATMSDPSNSFTLEHGDFYSIEASEDGGLPDLSSPPDQKVRL